MIWRWVHIVLAVGCAHFAEIGLRLLALQQRRLAPAVGGTVEARFGASDWSTSMDLDYPKGCCWSNWDPSTVSTYQRLENHKPAEMATMFAENTGLKSGSFDSRNMLPARRKIFVFNGCCPTFQFGRKLCTTVFSQRQALAGLLLVVVLHGYAAMLFLRVWGPGSTQSVYCDSSTERSKHFPTVGIYCWYTIAKLKMRCCLKLGPHFWCLHFGSLLRHSGLIDTYCGISVFWISTNLLWIVLEP